MTSPEELVKQAEAAYQSLEIDRMMQLFDPEIVVYWNGKKIAEGLATLRRWHESWVIPTNLQDWHMQKIFRAASGDTIAVEWHSTWIDANGNPHTGCGGEFWIMRDDRLVEWRAYSPQPIRKNFSLLG
jgi:nuclear transport factor 2 (NTF2) superfamily protein